MRIIDELIYFSNIYFYSFKRFFLLKVAFI